MKKQSIKPQWKDRIVELRRVKSSDVKRHPKNPYVHGQAQREALEGVLTDVGIATAAVVYESTRYGCLTLIDGELRADTIGELPVLVLDVSDDEADVLLASMNETGRMSGVDMGKAADLLHDVKSSNPHVKKLLEAVKARAQDSSKEEAATILQKIDVGKRPPSMAWVLIGIPTLQFGKIASAIDDIAKLKDVICETALNDAEN